MNRSTAPVPPITLRRVERDDPQDREDREDAARDDQSSHPRRGRPAGAAGAVPPDSEPAGPPRTAPSPGHVDVRA